MVKLTNKANGPRSVHTSAGYVTIAAGAESEDLDISKEDMAAIEKYGVLDPADADPSGPRSIPGYPNLSLPERPVEAAAAEEEAEPKSRAKAKPADEK